MTAHYEFGSVIDEIVENHGGTYYLALIRGGRMVIGNAEFKTGYYVAVENRERQVPLNGDVFSFDKFVIADYIADNIELLKERDNYLGFWIPENGQRVYLDISKHVDNLDRAIQIGIATNQDAIWDIANGSEISL